VLTTVVARIEAEGLSMTRRLRRASINRLPSRLLLPSRIRRRVRRGRPTGTEALTSIETRARSAMNAAGQMVASDSYLSILSYTTATATLGAEDTAVNRPVFFTDFDNMSHATAQKRL